MSGTQVDRISGISSSLAIKAPVRVATTDNITSFEGLQTIDVVTLVAGDRVLVKSQTDTTENGIYYVQTSSPYTWARDKDFDGSRDSVKGTTVRVTSGTANAGTWWELTSANPVRIGTDAITWQQVTIPLASIATYLTGTSVSSVAVGTGAKVFTTQASLAWTAGTRLRVASDDSAKIMDGEVTTYSGTTLTLDIDYTEGSGTHADWNISIVGERGATGADGTVDITTQAAETAPAVADLLLMYDASETANNKITLANFFKLPTSLTAETAVDTADEFLIQDVSAGTADKATLANVLKGVTTLTDTAIASGDELLFCDVSDSNNAKKGNVSDIVALVTSTGGWVPIKTVTASAQATVDFVNGTAGVVLDSTYKKYAVSFTDVIPATDDTVFQMRTSTNAGSSYDAGASDYLYAIQGYNSGGSGNAGADAANTSIQLTDGGVGNGTGEACNGIVYINNPAGTAVYKQIMAETTYLNASTVGVVNSIMGARLAVADVDAIRFMFATGNITSGVFTLSGLKDAA